MLTRLRSSLTIVAFLLSCTLAYASPPNVLMIAVDDLNDWISCLHGHPDTATPNIDKLAERGVLFSNAHCQGTMCNPSRISIMWGKRPSSTGFYSNNIPAHKFPDFLKSNTSLSRTFKSAGYKTMTAGKIYHAGWLPKGDFDVVGPKPGQWSKHDKAIQKKPDSYHRIWDFGPQSYPEPLFVDHIIATWAADQLSNEQIQPFFMTVGFMRPHVPFFPPERIYNHTTSARLPKVKETDWDDIPEAARKAAMSNPKIPTHEWMNKEGRWQEAVKNYLACVKWVDDQIGRVLTALENSPYTHNTIIILYSDHGYHLGEKQRWSKFSLWERTTRVPFIISSPYTSPGRCSKPVELLSIYPTLLELCEIPANDQLEGASLVPLLKNPRAEWPHVAITTLGENNHAVRNDRWRYIRYADGSEELYDHEHDPHEWSNLVTLGLTEEQKKAINKLKTHLPELNKTQMQLDKPAP